MRLIMWSIMFNQNGNKVIPEQDNPKYYMCKRFFTNERYRAFSKLPLDEIISVDSMLFPIDERISLKEKEVFTQNITNGQQILRVYCIDHKEVISVAEVAEDFIFCGYDLAEEFEISALTNCGGFDETFIYKDLNQFGLIPDFITAKRMQIDLANNNPNEEHADCLLFAIWRKI